MIESVAEKALIPTLDLHRFSAPQHKRISYLGLSSSQSFVGLCEMCTPSQRTIYYHPLGALVLTVRCGVDKDQKFERGEMQIGSRDFEGIRKYPAGKEQTVDPYSLLINWFSRGKHNTCNTCLPNDDSSDVAPLLVIHFHHDHFLPEHINSESELHHLSLTHFLN